LIGFFCFIYDNYSKDFIRSYNYGNEVEVLVMNKKEEEMVKKLNPFILIGKNGVEEIDAENLVYSSSMQYGFGLFETLKINENGEIVFWHDHYWRMYNSAKFFGLPFYWHSADLLKLIKKNLVGNYTDCLLRIYLFLSPLYGYKNINTVESKMVCSLLTEKSPIMKRALLHISNMRRFSTDFATKHKLTQRAHLILVTKEYKKLGADEGLLLNENGYITEGTRSNIFFYRSGKFYTPSLEAGLLPGVTRKKIIQIMKKEGYEVEEGFYTPSELLNSEEIFITFTTVGIAPVYKVLGDEKEYMIDKAIYFQKKLEEEILYRNEYFRVLFVCKENSIRSIFAQALMDRVSQGKIHSQSAGISKGNIKLLTKTILEKEGFNPAQFSSKALNEELIKETDFVITVCDTENCVILNNLDPKTKLIRWYIREPNDTIEDYYSVYKEIELKCKQFYESLFFTPTT
jgi:branched-subunit amino acid aminotransferase/4-amino-4-deoxychorismate lyase/protein-tyrosine-phosphatase